MINKEQLLKELEKEFESFRKEVGFKTNLEEIDSIFDLKNDVLSKGFVPEKFPKYLSSLIADYFRGWHGYLNGLLVPNTNFYANQTEAKLFNSEKDRKVIWSLIGKAMEFSSESALINLESSVQKLKDFIDDSYAYCVSEFRPEIFRILEKVNIAWKSK